MSGHPRHLWFRGAGQEVSRCFRCDVRQSPARVAERCPGYPPAPVGAEPVPRLPQAAEAQP